MKQQQTTVSATLHHKPKVKVSTICMYVFLSIAAFVSIFPLVWTLISATNSNADVLAGRLIPGANLAENWRNLTAQQNVLLAFWNSARNAIVLTIGSLLICSLAGYGFEVFHSKWKDRLMGVLLLSMMVPFAAIMIPMFTMFGRMNEAMPDFGMFSGWLGMLNGTLGFILPTLATAFLVMLFRQSARSFPHDMVEAARIDGLSEISIFFRIFMPTMKSTYAAAAIITFMAAWNVFLWPRLIMMGPDSVTLPLMLSSLLGGYVIDNGVNMLAVVIATVPTVVLFFFLQKHFAEGMAGSVK